MQKLSLMLSAIALAFVGHAEMAPTVEEEYGTLNPQDTGVEMLHRKIEMGVTDSITCSLGYNVTK